jgi:hypothetical protein
MPDRHAAENYDDRDLDALLNQALASYTNEEPDPSLRARIMARTAEAAPRRSRIWWLTAAACAAAILLLLLMHPANHTSEDRALNAPAIAPAPPSGGSAKLDPAPISSPHSHVVAATRHSYRSNKSVLPSRSIFVASAPLTQEEATLLRFAQQHPQQARQVLSAPPSEPLQTKPLVIAPIQIADLSGSQPDAH